ncbi:MAG: hypothetical protein GWP03_05600 [Proteobacteria bacterium]|nr:hypothetical protein [Pseudomonadota bacterium]
MKTKISLLTLMLFALFLSLNGKNTTAGGFGGFTFSSVYNDYTNLNTNLQSAGYSTITKGFYFGRDGSGYGIINNILIGGSSVSSQVSTENGTNSAIVKCEGGYFDIGYLFSPVNYVSLFPLIGFGSMTYSLDLRPSIGDTYFDSLLVNPGRISTIVNRSFSVAFSGNVMFRLPFPSQYSFLGLVVGGGYALTPSFGSWKTSDGSVVNQGPAMPMGVPFARASVVFGGGTF